MCGQELDQDAESLFCISSMAFANGFSCFFRHMMKGPCGMRKNRFHVDMSRRFFVESLYVFCSQTRVILFGQRNKKPVEHK